MASQRHLRGVHNTPDSDDDIWDYGSTKRSKHWKRSTKASQFSKAPIIAHSESDISVNSHLEKNPDTVDDSVAEVKDNQSFVTGTQNKKMQRPNSRISRSTTRSTFVKAGIISGKKRVCADKAIEHDSRVANCGSQTQTQPKTQPKSKSATLTNQCTGLKLNKNVNDNTDKNISHPPHSITANKRNVEGYCPFCQAPYSALTVDSPRSHTVGCMDLPIIATKECSKREFCTDPILSHYRRFVHTRLANKRAGIIEITEQAQDEPVPGPSHASPAGKADCFTPDSPDSAISVSENKLSEGATPIDLRVVQKKNDTLTITTSPNFNHQISIQNKVSPHKNRKSLFPSDQMLCSDDANLGVHALPSSNTSQPTRSKNSDNINDYGDSDEDIFLSSTPKTSVLVNGFINENCIVDKILTCEALDPDSMEMEKDISEMLCDSWDSEHGGPSELVGTQSNDIHEKANDLFNVDSMESLSELMNTESEEQEEIDVNGDEEIDLYTGIKETNCSLGDEDIICTGTSKNAALAENNKANKQKMSCLTVSNKLSSKKSPGIKSKLTNSQKKPGNKTPKGTPRGKGKTPKKNSWFTPSKNTEEHGMKQMPIHSFFVTKMQQIHVKKECAISQLMSTPAVAAEHDNQLLVKTQVPVINQVAQSLVPGDINDHFACENVSETNDVPRIDNLEAPINLSLIPISSIIAKSASKTVTISTCLSATSQANNQASTSYDSCNKKPQANIYPANIVDTSDNASVSTTQIMTPILLPSMPKGSLVTNWGPRKKSTCPFYKKIPGTPFTVDAFGYGPISGCSAYLLSHFHYDHYGGLTSKFTHALYCSKITANLVRKKLRVEDKYIQTLNMNIPYLLHGIEITLLEANHCPGSVLFLIRLSSGVTHLHTGDFRAHCSMETYSSLKQVHINTLYLDTTYCDPQYKFPPQDDVIRFAVDKALDFLYHNPNGMIAVGAYTIGKERIFIAIAEALNCKICVTSEKKGILECIENPALYARLTTKANEAKVHVLPMAQLKGQSLVEYLERLSPRFCSVLGFEPTGWTHSQKLPSLSNSKPKFTRGNVKLYGIPYSEHSSYDEMKRFVQFVRPTKILPTVNNGNASSRKKMEQLFKTWLSEDSEDSATPSKRLKQAPINSWFIKRE